MRNGDEDSSFLALVFSSIDSSGVSVYWMLLVVDSFMNIVKTHMISYKEIST